MDVVNIASYAHYGSKQFPVNISIIRSTALIEHVRAAGATTFERSYSGLHVTSIDDIVSRNFDGFDLWGAWRKCEHYYCIFPPNPGPSTVVRNLWGMLGMYTRQIDMTDTGKTYSSSSSFVKADSIVNVLGQTYPEISGYTYNYSAGNFWYTGSMIPNVAHTSCFIMNHTRLYTYTIKYVHLTVVPDDYFVNGVVNQKYVDNPGENLLDIDIELSTDNDNTEIQWVNFNDVTINTLGLYNTFFSGIKTPDYAQKTDDIDNPYGEPGTSGPGGGDGDYGDPDEVDPTSVPDLPTVSAASTGFITIYNPSNANLAALGQYLWSSAFDLDTFKKMYADPMECIISLGIVPCLPNSGGTRNIYFGNIDTGINCTFLSSQYAKVDCGSVNIQKYVGSFMDYSPYVKVNLFLPYIGFIHLGTDDIMGGSINVTYHVDVLSGDCIAFITHSSKGVLYSYTGNCLTNVPVTAANYASSLRNYYEAVMGIIPSTANGAMSGGAAGAAGGAIAGALSAASNIVLNTKPDFQRSGSLGGSAGIMGVQKPFIIIERPNISVPNKVQHYMGQTSNMTASLGGLSGMTIVEAVHLEGIPCTTSELAEIESILKTGVIL